MELKGKEKKNQVHTLLEAPDKGHMAQICSFGRSAKVRAYRDQVVERLTKAMSMYRPTAHSHP